MTQQESHKYQAGDILALSDGYYRVYDDGQRLRLWFERDYLPGEIITSNAPKRIVMVQPLNGEPIKDEEWAAGVRYTGPKLTMPVANAIIERQEQQEEIAASYCYGVQL